MKTAGIEVRRIFCRTKEEEEEEEVEMRETYTFVECQILVAQCAY
jgi:hypothetical protein